VQLYGARSKASWGIGDLGDLRRIASWKRSGLGGGMLMVNPLHAVAPTAHQQNSPYLPTSRLWRNPLYIRVTDVPGSADIDLGARALNEDRLVNRDEVWRQKRKALGEIFAAGIGSDARAWIEGQPGLLRFATWCALADIHGPDWREWPADLRRPESPAVGAWERSHGEEVRFHAWLQWVLHVQLGDAAAAGSTIVHDLAIGADPGGADAWAWQDVIAPGVIVGAPPDEFNPQGQLWGMPPFDPWKLRAAQYEPFIQLVRAAFAGGGGVRIDHVIGLFRLYWVPEDGSAVDGAYVRYPWEDLLNILALEADRAGAFVIGEDLGTVEPEVREELAARAILSYQLLWFEDRPPADWPELALAAVTTHDLPTFAGLQTGADARARRSLGLPVDPEADQHMVDRLEAVGDDLDQAYRALSASPALLAVGSLDDALGVEERPNHPGTVDEWPNWRIALPEPLEHIETSPAVRAAADALASGGRA
jgi:4-alpha-glucanotransferase